MSFKIKTNKIKGFFICLFIISAGFFIFPKITQATVWTSPGRPVINGNNYTFVTIGDVAQANQAATIVIKDPSSITKQTCNVTRNEYGYARCKYTFSSSDSAGTWTYTATSETGGNISVGKITMSLADANDLTAIEYGEQTTINVDISYNNVMPKPIVVRPMGRDLGTYMGRNDMVDIDGDGDLEIISTEYNGRVYIWEDFDRFYNEGTMLISGTDWRSADYGAYHMSSGCVFEDFDSDGDQTMICGDYYGRLYAWADVDLTDGTDVAYSYRSDDEGDSIRTLPVLCDVDDDGIADQVAVGIYQGYIVFYEYTDTGGFVQKYKSGDLGTMHYGVRPVCGDFDADGYNEWIVGEYNGKFYFYDVDRGDSNNIVPGDQAIDRGSHFGHGAAADFDNDGQDEAVMPLTSGRFQLLSYTTTTASLDEDLTWATDTDWGTYYYGGGHVKFDDLNKNGRPDFGIADTYAKFVFTEYDPDTVDWYQTQIGQGYERSYNEVEYVDFDGDGIKEIMAFGRYSGNTYIYQFNGEDWDLIYEGWEKDYIDDTGGHGDGRIYGNQNAWFYTQKCAVGDIDDDDLEEAICFPYDGRSIVYEQADRVEENVSPEIYLTVSLNDGNYQDPDEANMEIRILNGGELLALSENIALGITDVVDEDNQNQDSLNPRWTDGVKSSYTLHDINAGLTQASTDYSDIDSSTTEEAVYSRIKLGDSYQVGAIKVWNYFGDGRSYRDVIIRSTNDSSGDLCDFTTNDLLFDNSADGSNLRYSEGVNGKSIYFSPVTMSCLRESTAGSSYYTTSLDSGNDRTEIEIYETDDYASFNAYLERTDDSTLDVKDDWTIDVTAADRTGNLINISDQLTIPVTYDELPFYARIVGGTEYYPGDAGQLVIQIKDEFNDPVTGATCTVDYYGPDASLWLDDQATLEIGSTGIYYDSFTASTTEGVYIAISTCTSGAFSDTDSHTFHTSKSVSEGVWDIDVRTLTDYATSSITDAIWNRATSSATTEGSFGKVLAENIDDQISGVAASVWAYSTRTLSSFGTLVSDIWSNGSRTLSTFGSLAADIWNDTYAPVRKLTSRQIGSGAEYMAGVSSAGLVTQVANDADQSTIQYDVDLVRQATFDFAGFADSGTTLTLVDSELDQPDDYWNDYRLKIMSGDNIGEERTVSDFDAGTDTITVSSAFSNAISNGDKYVLQHETRLIKRIWTWSSDTATFFASAAGEIWSYTSGRTLSSATNVAADIWGATTRRLTDETLSDGGSLATQSYIDTATSTLNTNIIAEIDANQSLIIDLDSDVALLSATTTLILDNWTTYDADDIIAYIDEIETALGNSANASTTETIFGRTKYLQEQWGTQTAQTIFDKASSTLVTLEEVQSELGFNGTTTNAYDDLQLVKTYVDDLESYIGTPSDTATSTLFGMVRDVRDKLYELDTIDAKLDIVDTIVDGIRASQILDYTVELSDVGEVQNTKTYRAKLTVLDYEENPSNASTTPTIIIYDANRATAESGSMTLLSTGVYEYTYLVAESDVGGLWETVVTVDLAGADDLTFNDYWEVEGAPAQVLINSVDDSTITSISADVTITNEGNVDYEYQYEWCVVNTEDNECGGGDDIDYASAAKLITVGEDWNTNLSATVNTIGDYWFKLVVYFGTESSGASRTFTATTEEEEEDTSGGGSGSGSVVNADIGDVYTKLLRMEEQLGYGSSESTVYEDLLNTRYHLGALPNQLSEPLYNILTDLSSEIESIGGTNNYNLDQLYEVSQVDSGDLKYIANKVSELKALVGVNKQLISGVANQPVIQTWFTEGSVILNVLVVNPPDTDRIIQVKQYLPKEIRAEHVLEIDEGLELEYDSSLDTYYITGQISFIAGERKIFKVKTEDVFEIFEEELIDLQKQTETLTAPLEGTSYFAQASILKSEIDANIDAIKRRKVESLSSIEKKISLYRESQKDLIKIQSNINSLRNIVSEVSGKSGILGSFYGTSTIMSWGIIVIVIIGVVVLMILLYNLLSRSRALEHYIANGKKLKAPPMVNVKKQAQKIKGGLITYLLPPFGQAVVDLKKLIKLVKILLLVVLSLVIILGGLSFLNKREQEVNNKPIVIDQEEDEVILELEEEIITAEKKYLEIIETGLGWLNARSEPSLDSEILTKVTVGDSFEYVDKAEGLNFEGVEIIWYQIILEDGIEAWVSGEYINILENE